MLLDRVSFLKKVLRRAGLITAAQATSWDRDVQRCDIKKLPFPDKSVAAVYSSHALEHIYLAEVAEVLAEAFRVLIPGGMIRLALPDATQMARELLVGVDQGSPDAGRTFNERLLAFPSSKPGLVTRAKGALGGHVHRWQPTPDLMTSMLLEAGFENIQQRCFKDGLLPDVEVIETRSESFFIEATTPR